MGHRIPGVQVTATAASISAALFLPVAVVIFLRDPPDAFTVLCAVGAGVLASVVPYVADLVALRRITPDVFGILLIVAANACALLWARKHRRGCWPN